METVPEPVAHPVASASRKVHPVARWVAGLLSPMSLQDQCYCTDWFQRILWGSLAFSFPLAYFTGTVLITVGGVCAATVVCLVLFVPNWYQHSDPALKYANDTQVYHYYQQYNAAKKSAREASSSSKKVMDVSPPLPEEKLRRATA
ncbi:hypothetical protein JKF63_04745 [Porcisia hertigi]|uniref:Uncharacterized protein n=1 Tax=Porcisia hertigi TaxID=2761500 RepID=A0A836LAJ0_9TRYP|nr:hypothetical protein JKF63_04745 [Porcisia hertigi]